MVALTTDKTSVAKGKKRTNIPDTETYRIAGYFNAELLGNFERWCYENKMSMIEGMHYVLQTMLPLENDSPNGHILTAVRILENTVKEAKLQVEKLKEQVQELQ